MIVVVVAWEGVGKKVMIERHDIWAPHVRWKLAAMWAVYLK